jgi:hypothetical protein
MKFIQKLQKKQLLASSCLSIHQHGTILLPPDGFLWNLIFKDFSNICPENSSLIKVWQDMCTIMIISHWIALEWEMFWSKVVEKVRTHSLYSVKFFLESCAICEIKWKNMVEPYRLHVTIQYNILLALDVLDNWGKNTHTHAEYLILTVLLWQQVLGECASLLQYMYVSCLLIEWR